MNQGVPSDAVPGDVLDDVASVVGAEVSLIGRLPGGLDVGAIRVQLDSGADAILKAWPRTRPDQLEEVLRAQRVVAHMRGRGYPTPACLGVGATATHVWSAMEFVDAAPAPELTPSIVEQLMAIVELQAGQATEQPHDHWAYSWRLATGGEYGQDLAPSLSRAVAGLSGYSPEVAVLVERIRRMCATVPPPRSAPDMVHADFKPDNVLVRNGVVVAVVDIGNAGSGTRATDLATLQWHTYEDHLDGARARLWTRIVDLTGWEGAAVPTATQILTQLEFPIRQGRDGVVPGVVARGHRALDELEALR
ncbi:MAG TPA: aminoglycoside phosphotransferase family protein [Thermomicrobiales bacterium]|nr:aminoglycoside phosphotransferase family protein [Thermomicrobiales bacterium]